MPWLFQISIIQVSSNKKKPLSIQAWLYSYFRKIRSICVVPNVVINRCRVFFFALDIGKWNFRLFSVSEEVWVVNGLWILMASTTSTYIILRSAHHHFFFVGILIFDLGNFGIHDGYDYFCCILLEFQTESLNHHYLHYLHWLLNVPMPAELYDFKVFRSLRVFRGETFQVSLLARRNRCEARYFPRDFSRESGLVAAVSHSHPYMYLYAYMY